jgi:HK97 family phage prohead protease
MLHKTCPAQVKAAGPDDGLEEGQFRAVVSVFGNKDSYGDKVMPGAFADTLAAWKAKGDPIPVFWSHQMSDPDMCVGEVLDAKETAVGLEVLAQLDLDEEARKARQTYRLLKGRRVTQFSFAYDIVEAAWVETEDEWWYELRKLNLFEVGPTPIGANQETELLAVKSAAQKAKHIALDVKAGRELSAKNESMLTEVADALDLSSKSIRDLLASVSGGEESNDEKAKAGEPAAPTESKDSAGAPMRMSPSDESELLSIEFANAD